METNKAYPFNTPKLQDARNLLIEAHVMAKGLSLDNSLHEIVRESAHLIASRIDSALSVLPRAGERITTDLTA